MPSSLSAALAGMFREALSAPPGCDAQRFPPVELGAPEPNEMPSWRDLLPDERARYALQLVRISNPPFTNSTTSEMSDD